MAQQIQLRRGTASQWTSVNPVLAQGEPGVETDTSKFKIGDGSTAWTALAYASGATPPDAATGTKGIVQLAGDLSGTAATPRVTAGAITVDKLGADVTPALPLLTPSVSTAGTGTLTAGAIHRLDATSGALVRTLPTAAAAGAGGVVVVKKIDGTSNTITVNRASSDTINVSGTSRVLALPYEAAHLRSDGVSDWTVIASDIPSSAVEAVNTVAASGSAVTIPAVTAATINDVTLTANCTFTFPTPVAGGSFTLRLTQDATGGRTVIWPGTVKWSGAVAPILSTGATKQDVLTFMSIGGSSWQGFLAGLDMR